MPPNPNVDDPWSDSDEELDAGLETAVQLGIPDGPLSSPTDILDPAVSRIGGHPAFLSVSHPPSDSANCKVCTQPMELLIQIWCPLEDSPNDRALFVWACANGSCQRKEGSVRAWRQLRFNKKYAEKLEKKLARRKEKEARQAQAVAEAAAKRAQPKSNPFALGGTSAPNPFGMGSQIFGGTAAQNNTTDCDADDAVPAAPGGSPPVSFETDSEDDGDENEDGDDDDDTLAAAFESTSLDDSPWKQSPAYSPLYLSTVSEYLPPPPKVKVPAAATVDPDEDRASKDGGGWTLEGYENSIDIDHAFERFSKRVSHEGEQCLRYELGGAPLPFASDKVFDLLFPVPPAPPLPVTKPDFVVTPARKRTYALGALPVCPHCSARRVFECQLMPNLINVLKPPFPGGQKALSDEERRAEVLRTLKGQGNGDRRGMEWGTCMVFTCEKDCAVTGEAGTWREEYVLVQWDE